MKRIHIHWSILLVVAFTVISCEKSNRVVITPERNDIVFQVMTNGISVESESSTGKTKAEITTDNVSTISIFGKKNNVNFMNPNETIQRQGQDIIWSTKSRQYQWENESSYKFHGYAHTPVKNGSSLTINNEGKSVTVTQPSKYFIDLNTKENTSIDYLLSYEVEYQPSTTHSVVPIKLEHAFTKVNLYITRASSMKDLLIENLQISFNNIKNNATITCTEQKNYYNENQTQNTWTYDIGTSVANYIGNFDNDRVAVDGDDNKPLMSFIAVPNDHEGLKDYIIHITYQVKENIQDATAIEYTREFKIPQYTSAWSNGKIVEYKFIIDNGIHLTSNILPWTDVDYIEGTILPPITEDDTPTTP